MKQHDIIIVGAGISGLSLAHYCAKAGMDVLVIEKSERTGGSFHSHGFGGETTGFWLELGAHTCYNSYGNLIGIIEDCRMSDRIIRRESVPFKLVVNDQVKSIPSQLDFIEFLLSAPRLFTLKKAGRSVESYYSKIVGRRNFERVFGHVFDAVISQEAGEFPADMLFKKRPRRKDVLKKFTMSDGLQLITDSLAAQPGVRVMTGEEVQAIEFGDGLFNVKTAGGESYISRALALAAPAPVSAKLLHGAFPELSASLAKIKVNTVETVGVAIKKDAVSIGPVAGLIALEDSFYSAVSRDAVPHDKFRGFSFHFKAGALDHDSKLARISKVLGANPEQLKYTVDKLNVVPCLRVGHDELVDNIDGLISGRDLLLTGNYFSGMAIEDCISRSMREFQRLKAGWGRIAGTENAG
ncbi:MAG: FAD-dependent oxidoreductase [Deltaproteobacteria bacterium]|nr:FAD-dependent oxidoreductase [Deltaproteobacteria bacterium]